jgi:type II secretory pathway component PulF
VLIVIYLYKQYKYHFDLILYEKIPFVSQIYKRYLHYQLFLILSISLQSKNTINQTFNFVKNSFQNIYFNEIIKTLIDDINNGQLFYDAFKKEKSFDDYILRLLLLADNTNNYEKCFKSLSKISLGKIDTAVVSLSKYIEPILMLIIGILLLLMILGVMSPVWEFSKIG